MNTMSYRFLMMIIGWISSSLLCTFILSSSQIISKPAGAQTGDLDGRWINQLTRISDEMMKMMINGFGIDRRSSKLIFFLPSRNTWTEISFLARRVCPGARFGCNSLVRGG